MNAHRYVYAAGKSAGLARLVKKYEMASPEARFEIEYEQNGAALATVNPPLPIQSLVDLLREVP